MSLTLTPKERSAILAGEHPVLIRPYCAGEPCPFVKSEEVVLKSHSALSGPVPLVWITITGSRRTKQGTWRGHYSIRDDRSLYLARGPGYTRSASSSIDPDAAVTDEETLREYAVQGRLRRAERADERKDREKALRERLRVTLKDLQPEAQIALLGAIEREIQKAQIPSAEAA